MLLERINSVTDLKKISVSELDCLADEIREYIVDIISQNGGHLSSSLGVVDLTIALHYVFRAPRDKIIWDVGHQTYTHKILTGRREQFKSIRQFQGLSGFPKRCESEYDAYDVGHSSTSLSLALGEAVGRDLNRKKYKVVAVIGDGSLNGGMSFEALNQIGHMKNDLIIILNDNEHSISKNVGALSEYLTRVISGAAYNRFRRKSMELIKKIPRYGDRIFNFIYRLFLSFKGILIPGQLFQDMGIRYFGPVDGHDIPLLINVFENVKKINSGPKIIHVITRKGKGYLPAEMDPSRFHGIGSFDKATGIALSGNSADSYSEVAGKTLAHLAAEDKKIIAITAAMKQGTGLCEFEKKSPRRFFDVGISEQHAVTFAGALASTGMKPFVSIYSTFLQRAVDQLIHDIALMNLPVRLLVDRSGIVGNDGETHHGLFDISIIRNIPNFIFLAPSSGEELRDMLYFASSYNDGPVAIRYPRGRIRDTINYGESNPFTPGKIRVLSRGGDVALLALGDMLSVSLEIEGLLKEKGISATTVSINTIKPLDLPGIHRVLRKTRAFVTLENGILSGGLGEYIVSQLDPGLYAKQLFRAGFPDEFICHGDNARLFKEYGIDAVSLCRRIVKDMARNVPG